ncbi:TetR/AcrR family transcriptional regulator [Paenibacillus monticola]|uniref:TetR family transcriptional regulator n=1 Tax=Paenibacillus monticola TaxID=2666075 RepID=A0A7X2H727_9BACL|nr:TetR/AcrR family transcriptional regulator [Paenibacillus monticola]MRN53973.1 TetR family transcriptional regulator [Paenibacillus monticola]
MKTSDDLNKTLYKLKLTSKGQATRNRIVEAAADLMSERGIGRTSVEDVQRLAKVSASQLYHYFSDKKELVRAVIAHQTEAVLDAQQPYLSKLDSFEALQSWRDLIIEIQTQRQCKTGCPIGSLVGEISETEEEARSELVSCFAQWEAEISRGLHEMYNRGELRSESNPASLALALLTALQGGLLLSQVRREVAPLAAGLDAVLDHIRSFAT